MPVYRLTTFGGLTLTADGAPLTGAAAQRRRLALLALLASTPRGISRDALAGYLWGESEGDKARHSLEQALYAIRGVFGADCIPRDATTVRLNPSVIASDVAEFDDAIRDGAHDRVVALYAGPFLAGFYVDEAPEFERWVEEERSRREQAVCKAFEALARAATQRGDHAGASEWWRRYSTIDPVSGRVAVELMNALVRMGDRAAALRHARAHEELVRRELDAAPEPEMRALTERLRQEAAGERGTSEAPAPVTATSSRADRSLRQVRQALNERYEIVRQLDRGTVATAFSARERSGGRDLILKVFGPGVVAHTNVDALLASLRTLTGLVHPRILRILDAGDALGYIYYACAPYNGQLLRDRLAREGALPPADVERIAVHVADALAYAHEHQSLHLDLTPKRIALTPTDTVLLDYGITRAIIDAAAAGATETSIVVGTPAYMSPEVASGEGRVDVRSDIYSLGSILYHALAGEPPPAAYAEPAPRPPSAIRSRKDEIPLQLEEVVMRMIERRPADRFDSAEALLTALSAFTL